jgi:asparagine synthetase B (glutamine-hydrolysing)
MKYWEIIADDLSKAGWSSGCVAAVDSKGRTIWIADTHRSAGAAKISSVGIFPSPDTPFGEIRKVAPGQFIQFDIGGMRRRSYWRWQITETAKQPLSLDMFDQMFRTAVGRQTDVDVDFGVFLSRWH